MNYLEGLTKAEREEVTKLIDAEIQWYLEQFKRYEEDMHKPIRPGLKTPNPLCYELIIRLMDENVWDALPAWQRIVYEEVMPYSPMMKAIDGIIMCDDPDPKVRINTFEMYAQ